MRSSDSRRRPLPRSTATTHWAEAGRRVIRRHLTRVLGHVAGSLDGEDPEEIHAMRVAGRRVRAAWRVFGDGFEPEARRRYRDDLRAIGGHLGAVRDMDVRLGILDAYAGERSSRRRVVLEPLRTTWRAERDARHAGLVEILRSTAFERFVSDYLALALETGCTPARPVATGRRRSWDQDAGRDLGRLPVGLGLRGRAAGCRHGDPPPAPHRGEMAALRDRVCARVARARTTLLLRRVVALQDRLGDIHDLDGAAGLARLSIRVPAAGRGSNVPPSTASNAAWSPGRTGSDEISGRPGAP